MQSPETFSALDDDAILQLNKDGKLRHLLTLKGLDRTTMTDLLDEAQRFVSPLGSAAVRNSSLAGRTVANLFFEPSTRTRASFDLAAKRLGADVLNLDVNTSSRKKGQGLKFQGNSCAAQAGAFPPASAQAVKKAVSQVRTLKPASSKVAKSEKHRSANSPAQMAPEPQKFLRPMAGPRNCRSASLLSIGTSGWPRNTVRPSQWLTKLLRILLRRADSLFCLSCSSRTFRNSSILTRKSASRWANCAPRASFFQAATRRLLRWNSSPIRSIHGSAQS